MVRSRRRDTSLEGRDTFHVLSDGSQLAVKGAAPHALNVAQRKAEQSKEGIVLTVERHSLFGPATTIYRVTRTPEGVVFTNTNLED